MRQRAAATAQPAEEPQELTEQPQEQPPQKLDKLNFKEQRELDALPAKLAAIEAEQSELHTAMADPEFFKQDSTVITEATSRLESLDKELGTLYARWEELEARS
jgi:ATP-binding cassette subfamily F protein uup